MDKIEIIAEIGWNHMGDMDLAMEMIKEAKNAGADYAKFQTWSVDRLKPGAWDEDGRKQIYEKAELSLSDHERLKLFCDKMDIEFMSSVFSIPDVELLSQVTTKCVKIPSFESRNVELIQKCLMTFDNVYMSTGTSTLTEIESTLFEGVFHRWEGTTTCGKLKLMHCVSSYPLKPEDANLAKMVKMIETYDRSGIVSCVGYSDHMEGVESAKIAIEFGATTIEKHFTTDNNLPGRDNKFACLPKDIKDLRNYINLREAMLSKNDSGYQECESDSRRHYEGRFNG